MPCPKAPNNMPLKSSTDNQLLVFTPAFLIGDISLITLFFVAAYPVFFIAAAKHTFLATICTLTAVLMAVNFGARIETSSISKHYQHGISENNNDHRRL